MSSTLSPEDRRLVTLEVDTLDEAIALVNANPFGNGTGLFTQSGAAARKFQSEPVVVAPFYEQPWFATVLRNGVALICVLLLIFFGLRPAIAAMRRKTEGKSEGAVDGDGPRALAANGEAQDGDAAAPLSTEALLTERLDRMKLADQVGLAQRFINEQPDSAMAAIRQMLAEADPAKADAA